MIIRRPINQYRAVERERVRAALAVGQHRWLTRVGVPQVTPLRDSKAPQVSESLWHRSRLAQRAPRSGAAIAG